MTENTNIPQQIQSSNDRKEFLMHLYDQMFNDIDRHILVVWQSIGVLIATLALFSLVEKKILPLDIAASLVVLVGIWLLAHLQDAAYWYNRNLAIIANVERQFLNQKDLRDIHYYFGKHRRVNKMLTHLKIQYFFGVSVVVLVGLYHFIDRVLPGIGAPWENFEPQRSLPYVFTIAGVILLVCLWAKRKKDYKEFLDNSPGIDIPTDGVSYGSGHPTDNRMIQV